MPIYEYECPGCGARFERHCDYEARDHNLPLCTAQADHVNNQPMQAPRVPSLPSVAFKGDGWTPRFHG